MNLQRRYPISAELQPNGGTHFRVWAPRPKKVEVLLEAGPGSPATVQLKLQGDGYFAIKGSLNIWRFHQILRANKSFHFSLCFSPIHLIHRYQRMIPTSRFFPVVGRPLADTTCMILVTIRMKVLPEKRKELSQTITLLIGALRTEKGCRRCDFYLSMEDENELCILEEWETSENLNSHLESERFKVLRGAMNLLQEPYEMVFHTVAAEKKKKEAQSQPAV